MRLTSWVHLVEQLDPEYPLFVIGALMAADVHCPRHLLEVWPGCGGEARRLCVLWQKRFSQRGKAGCRRCLVVGIFVGYDRNLYAKVCDNLVGCPSAVARLEG
jgi:hypothetical protein